VNTPGTNRLEARVGIEPTNKGFADLKCKPANPLRINQKTLFIQSIVRVYSGFGIDLANITCQNTPFVPSSCCAALERKVGMSAMPALPREGPGDVGYLTLLRGPTVQRPAKHRFETTVYFRVALAMPARFFSCSPATAHVLDMAARSAPGCCGDPVLRFPRIALRSRSMKPTHRVIRPRNCECEL
jgi:hypothetical protein